MYKIIKRNRRSFSITVDAKGSVTVYAPLYSTDAEIKRVIRDKSHWIDKKVNETLKRNADNADILSGEARYIFGEKIFNSDKSDYKKISEEYLKNRIEQLSAETGLVYSSLKFKNYRRRWGCCDSKGNIILNYKTISLEKSVIDFVILHELCHTAYMNHGKNFHKLLRGFTGNEKEFNKYLKNMAFLLEID